jgi:hypothetical protein
MLAPMEAALLGIDDLQARVVLWILVTGNAAAAVLCVFAHFSPWSIVTLGVTVSLAMLSVALRGIWRMGLRWRPIAAIALFAVVFIQPALEPKVGPPDLVGFLVSSLAALGAFWLYYMICISNRWWPTEWKGAMPISG